MKRILLAAACVTGLATVPTADAATITFDGIPPTGDTTGVFAEAGFTLSVVGLFADSEGAGTELEPLCCASGGSLTVTESGGATFTFASVDLQREYFFVADASAFLRLEGFLGGLSQGVDVLDTASGTYSTFAAFVLAGTIIDTLVITGQRDFVAGVSFDNLVVNPAQVPEPASMFLVGMGVLVSIARKRARRHQAVHAR